MNNFIPRRNLKKEEQEFINNIYAYAKRDEMWATDLLTPMLTIPEKVIETRCVHAGYNIEPVASYSQQLFSTKNAVFYRQKEFCKFDRFEDNSLNPEETYEERVNRVVEMLTKPEVIRQCMTILFETHPEALTERFMKDKSFLKIKFVETSYNWVRLIVHQIWVGMERERLFVKAVEALSKANNLGLVVSKATKDEDRKKWFDFKIYNLKHDALEALVSIKSPRYARSYHQKNNFRDAYKNSEMRGQEDAKQYYGVEVKTVIIDHHAEFIEIINSVAYRLGVV